MARARIRDMVVYGVWQLQCECRDETGKLRCLFNEEDASCTSPLNLLFPFSCHVIID